MRSRWTSLYLSCRHKPCKCRYSITWETCCSAARIWKRRLPLSLNPQDRYFLCPREAPFLSSKLLKMYSRLQHRGESRLLRSFESRQASVGHYGADNLIGVNTRGTK